MNLPRALAEPDNSGLIVAGIAVIVAIVTLLYYRQTLRELIVNQRAKLGPLIQSGFQMRPVPDQESNVISVDSVSLMAMFDTVRPNREFPYFWGPVEDASGQDAEIHDLECEIKNVQEHISGAMLSLHMELRGWWFTHDRDKWDITEVVKLRVALPYLASSDSVSIRIASVGVVSAIHLQVSDVRYKDIWGHTGRALIGQSEFSWIRGRDRSSPGGISESAGAAPRHNRFWWWWQMRKRDISWARFRLANSSVLGHLHLADRIGRGRPEWLRTYSANSNCDS